MRQIAAASSHWVLLLLSTTSYRVVAAISAVIAVILGVLISWQMAVAFVIGAIMSGTAGFVGMKIATLLERPRYEQWRRKRVISVRL